VESVLGGGLEVIYNDRHRKLVRAIALKMILVAPTSRVIVR
jgi:predicted Rossmann fold nucleotide-binding protein DprA/Smf involved in DNA uptake